MKKFFSILLIFSVVLVTLSLSVSADINVYDASETNEAVNLGDEANGISHIAGQYLLIDQPFTKLGVSTASYSNNIGTVVFSLYNWAGDYASTVATTAVLTQTYENFADNAILYLTATSYLPAGEYMWTMQHTAEKVAVWQSRHRNLESNIIQRSFLDGNKHYGCFRSVVTYYTGTNVAAEKNSIVINLTEISNQTAEVTPVIIRDRTLVPLSYIEEMGAVVSLDSEIEEIAISGNATEIAIRIGDYGMTVNGVYGGIDVCAQEINGNIMVPLRAIAEALGNKVDYFEPGVVIVNTFVDNLETAIPIQ